MHATPSATPPVAPSRRVWEDDTIRRNIFTHLAVYGWRTMAVEWITLACTDKRGFETASSLVWASGGAHEHWADRLEAADQARRPTYLRAIRTVGILALSPDSLSEVIQVYPRLHTVVARNGDIEYTLRLVRDATGKIRSSTCSILCIPVSLELAQMGDAIAHLRANVPEDWNTTAYFHDFDIYKTSDMEALNDLVASHDFALNEPTLMLRDEDAGDLIDCLDMIGSRRYIDKIHLMDICLKGPSGEHGLSLPDAFKALDRIGVVQDAGIVVGRVCVDAGSAAQVFDLLLSRPDVMRGCESLRISFPLPSLIDIASLQQIKLATWTDPRITRQRLAHVHFDVPDRYPAGGDVSSRRMRLEQSTAFLDCLAQLCLCVGGATATHSLQLWDAPDGNAYIPEGHTKITQHFSKRFNQYLKGEINRMIIKQREAVASSWRRIGKCNFHRGRHAEAKPRGDKQADGAPRHELANLE